ncbi:MAG: hypothetical protein PHH98_04150 [Candidatus Gracilibacteria bacterium]|nr:hypothetical protein [Candidatus Gracilibacteria bacterium]
MAGWKVCIDLNNDGNCQEQSEPFNLTNNDGYYEFNSLATGIYKILEISHQNWIITNNSGYYNIDLSNGEVLINKNFGNFKFKGGNK